MASVTLHIRVRDIRWFREVAMRVDGLLEALDGEDLSPETERRVAALRAAIFDRCPADDEPPGDDSPSP